tara:strand:- start:303 stop:623 length:321 start_codon:yes stop_codon:yes gene_type:complete
MKKFKIFILLSIILFLASCGTIKEGFINQKKNSSDEFLVEKKSPLVMPPDYNELPVPNTNENKIDIKENEIKTLITSQESKNVSSDFDKDFNVDLEESLLKKIKKK